MYPWHVIDQDGRKLAGFNNESAAVGFVDMMQKMQQMLDPSDRLNMTGWGALHDDVFEKFLAQETGES